MTGEAEYQSFRPSPLPPNPELEIDSDMVQKLVRANRELMRLDMAAKYVPNAELSVSMYVHKEALLTSQMEGTQCTNEWGSWSGKTGSGGESIGSLVSMPVLRRKV